VTQCQHPDASIAPLGATLCMPCLLHHSKHNTLLYPTTPVVQTSPKLLHALRCCMSICVCCADAA
jgi:hypothetical protein